MKKIIILITLVISTASFSCEKIYNTTWMYYDETYGLDPWGQSTVIDEDKKKNVEKYLKGKGIKVFKVEITSDGIKEICFSAGCKSGKRIKCKIRENDITAMKNEKFYQ